MTLETFVISGDRELAQALDAERWWAAIERNAPRALTPVVHELRGVAPKRSGRLAAKGFETRARRVNQGFIQGVEVGIGARVSHGHLAERGHRIIPRGPSRAHVSITTVRINKRTGRQVVSTRFGLDPTARLALQRRRSAGATGFVPGLFFARKTLESRRAEVISLLERLVIQDLSR